MTKPKVGAKARASKPVMHSRIGTVRALMSEGQWSGTKAAELARAWGVALHTVSDYATRASDSLLEAQGGYEATRSAVYGRLEHAYALAEKQGDARSMVAACREMISLFGLDAPQKIAITDVEGNDLPAPFAAALEHPALTAFLVLHGRPPSREESDELIAGDRLPTDPLARPGRASPPMLPPPEPPT